MTASELYKVIDPIALWKPLFTSIVAELLGEQSGTGVSYLLREANLEEILVCA